MSLLTFIATGAFSKPKRRLRSTILEIVRRWSFADASATKTPAFLRRITPAFLYTHILFTLYWPIWPTLHLLKLIILKRLQFDRPSNLRVNFGNDDSVFPIIVSVIETIVCLLRKLIRKWLEEVFERRVRGYGVSDNQLVRVSQKRHLEMFLSGTVIRREKRDHFSNAGRVCACQPSEDSTRG